jgi:hypothetical protein
MSGELGRDNFIRRLMASRSETIEEQNHRRAITFVHGHFGEFKCHRIRSFPKSI